MELSRVQNPLRAVIVVVKEELDLVRDSLQYSKLVLSVVVKEKKLLAHATDVVGLEKHNQMNRFQSKSQKGWMMERE